MSRRAAVILAILLVLIMAAGLTGLFVALRSARRPQVHLIPIGFKGWASARYGVAGAPPLPVEEGKLLFRYGADGRLETSTPYEEGWSVSNYYYVDGDERIPLKQMPPGLEGQIWGAYTSSRRITMANGEVSREGASSHFFVGSEEEYEASREGHTWLPAE